MAILKHIKSRNANYSDAILATGAPDILTDEILAREETAYQAFLKQTLESERSK